MYPQIDPDKPILCLLPGSRGQEIRALLPIFAETTKLLKEKITDLQVVLPTLPNLTQKIQKYIPLFEENVPLIIATNHRDCFRTSSVALAASGTVTLEVALQKLPMVVTYKVPKVTEWLLRFLIRIPYVCIVNILLQKEVIPERLQKKCTPRILAQELFTLLKKTKGFATQQHAFANIRPLLSAPQPFGEKIADEIIGALSSKSTSPRNIQKLKGTALSKGCLFL
jgi:lipid-A-disaccharide synthase